VLSLLRFSLVSSSVLQIMWNYSDFVLCIAVDINFFLLNAEKKAAFLNILFVTNHFLLYNVVEDRFCMLYYDERTVEIWFQLIIIKLISFNAGKYIYIYIVIVINLVQRQQAFRYGFSYCLCIGTKCLVAVFVGSILEMRNLNVKFCTRNFVCGIMLLMIKSDMYNFYFLKRIRVVLLKWNSGASLHVQSSLLGMGLMF